MKLNTFLLKISLYCGMLMSFQVALYSLLPPRWIGMPGLNKLWKLPSGQLALVFMGDSVAGTVSENDQEKKSIPEFLQSQIKHVKVVDVSQPGYGPSIFNSYAQYLVASERKHLTYIFELNIRSFRKQTNGEGEIFEMQKLVLEHAANPLKLSVVYPMIVFKAFNLKPPQGDMLPDRFLAAAPIALNTEEKIARKRAWYGFELDEQGESFVGLIKLSKLLRQHNINGIFYFTPLPITDVKFDVQFLNQFDKIKSRISEAIRKSACITLDLSTSLNDNHFTNVEHLKESGRKFVARELSEHFESSTGAIRCHKQTEIDKNTP